MRPSRTASTASRPGSSAARSRDRGHHPPSTQPVVGPFGFSRNRSDSRESSTGRAHDAIGEMVGADIMSVSRPPAVERRYGAFVEDDAGLTTRVRDAPDTVDPTP